ncbi:MAG: hypothetical protein RMX65_002075 [Nostoc sp. DedQUE01]
MSNIEKDNFFIDEKDNLCRSCGYDFQDLTPAKHISIFPGQEIYSGLIYSNPKSFVKITYLFLFSSLCVLSVLGGSFPYLYFSRLI